MLKLYIIGERRFDAMRCGKGMFDANTLYNFLFHFQRNVGGMNMILNGDNGFDAIPHLSNEIVDDFSEEFKKMARSEPLIRVRGELLAHELRTLLFGKYGQNYDDTVARNGFLSISGSEKIVKCKNARKNAVHDNDGIGLWFQTHWKILNSLN